MGGFVSRIYRRREKKIVILGLDGSGKTSLLRTIERIVKRVGSNGAENTALIPTVGFNIESFEYNDRTLIMWDLSGNVNVRTYWKCYFGNVKGVIFVVNINDVGRKDVAIKLLADLAQEKDLIYSTFLVLLNKCDLDSLIDFEEINAAVSKIFIKRRSGCFKCSIHDSKSVKDAFDWFVGELP
jgi:small GTP-binding protein